MKDTIIENPNPEKNMDIDGKFCKAVFDDFLKIAMKENRKNPFGWAMYRAWVAISDIEERG